MLYMTIASLHRTVEISITMAKLTGLEAVESQRKFLTLFGIWPTKNETVFYNLCCCLTVLVSFGFSLVSLLEIPNHLNDYRELSELICVLLPPIVFCVKVCTFKGGRTYFLKLLQNLKQYPVEVDEMKIRRVHKFSKYLVIASTTVSIAAVTEFLLQPALGKQDLPVKFSYELGRYKSVMYAFQVLSTEITAAGLSFIDCLTINVVYIGITKLEVLGDKIRNTNNLKEDCLVEEFADITCLHNGLIE